MQYFCEHTGNNPKRAEKHYIYGFFVLFCTHIVRITLLSHLFFVSDGVKILVKQIFLNM